MRPLFSLLACIALVSQLPSGALAANPSASIKLQDMTPADIQLKFQVQKIGWKYDKVRIWGALTNSGTSSLKFVSVSFTAIGTNGEFLTRQKAFADPINLTSGEIGNIDNFILDTEGQMPAIIQYKVSCEKQ